LQVIMGTVSEDLRPVQARMFHAEAAANDTRARGNRNSRDAIVRELRAEDPKQWTLSRLADAVGCSKELIAYIVKTEETNGESA
jgi:hypothetical protein